MPTANLSKAALLMLFIVAVSVISWEVYLRNKGVNIAYDDGGPLWSDKRAKVYEPNDKATVFIGASRNKYDLDINTWKKLTGEEPLQLAMEGSCPLPILDNLGADENFKGKLVIDVTEGLFFSTSENNTGEPKQNIKFYMDETPAQKVGFQVNRFLESNLVFLDKDHLSLTAMLNEMEIPSRKGVFMMPIFPMDFGRVNFGRQNVMTDKFLTDTSQQKQVQNIWLFFRSLSKDQPPLQDKFIDSIIGTVKIATDKIIARGGKVLFVRTPSSGPFWQGEQMAFPRARYWDKLLAVTGCKGIHFDDYPAIDHFVCPEWSHLGPYDAQIFTRELVRVMQQEKGWSFPNQPAK
ncbi:MAG: hypothetical protein IPP72_05065 [Chitinophagaceae bacterium]|nr:hypothetical protein [Chitinophagaceae bacterium]